MAIRVFSTEEGVPFLMDGDDEAEFDDHIEGIVMSGNA